MGSKYRTSAPPVDWQRVAIEKDHELRIMKRKKDFWKRKAKSYRDAARELYLWTKGKEDGTRTNT